MGGIMRHLLLLVFTFLFSLGAFAWDAATEFKNNCAACHTIGGGDKIGPDLAGLSERRKEDWIIKFVKYPDGMIEGDDEEPGYEKQDATAKALFALYKPQRMVEQELSDKQIKDLVAYIKKESTGKAPKGKITQLLKQK